MKRFPFSTLLFRKFNSLFIEDDSLVVVEHSFSDQKTKEKISIKKRKETFSLSLVCNVFRQLQENGHCTPERNKHGPRAAAVEEFLTN